MRYLGIILYYGFFRYLPCSTTPVIGRLIEKMRGGVCRLIFKKAGYKANIEQRAHFGTGRGIVIGTYSSIGKNAKVPNDIQIGDYVMMGNNVTIFSSSHNFDRTDIPMIRQGSTSRKNPFIIEDDVWIGQGVIVLPKVTRIAKGTIIGAGSVVTKDFPEYSIIAGNPARLIRKRD